jgi:virulence-associated protein VagC
MDSQFEGNLSRRQESWESFFQLAAEAGIPDDFMCDRDDRPPQERELF